MAAKHRIYIDKPCNADASNCQHGGNEGYTKTSEISRHNFIEKCKNIGAENEFQPDMTKNDDVCIAGEE